LTTKEPAGDQASPLVYVGLLQDFTETLLPVTGAAQARKVLDTG
jgi:hypothetical protein